MPKPPAPDFVETTRLRGERLATPHWEAWRELGTDVRLMATLGGAWTEEQARARFEWNLDHWDQHGHGQWMFFAKADGRVVGRCGIRRIAVNGKDEIELGYAVVPQRWGQGFATEMGGAAMQAAFVTFSFPSVVAFTLVDNTSSERVMHKLGFALEGHFDHAGYPHVLYRLRNPISF